VITYLPACAPHVAAGGFWPTESLSERNREAIPSYERTGGCHLRSFEYMKNRGMGHLRALPFVFIPVNCGRLPMKHKLVSGLALGVLAFQLTAIPTEAMGFESRAFTPPEVALEVARLTPPDGTGGDRFGEAVWISPGDAALVAGAPGNSHLGVDQGAVYCYSQGGSNWNLDQKLIASDGESGDLFGSSIAVGLPLQVVIGAPSDQVGGQRTGSVYVFEWNGTSYVEHQKLVASDAADLDEFGASLSLNTDPTLAIGAPGKDGQGAVYIFDWDGAQFVEVMTLTAGDGAAGDDYGHSIALGDWGDYAMIGAPGVDGLGTDSGSVYIYQSQPGFPFMEKYSASDGEAGDLFGYCIAPSYWIVGAPGDDDDGLDAGAVYELHHSGSGWSDSKYDVHDASAGDNFGCSVALGSCEFFVGADGENEGGADAGGAHGIGLCTPGWATCPVIRNSSAADDRFGRSVSIGDNLIAVGAPGDDTGGPEFGAVTIHELVPIHTVTCTGENCGCPCNNDSFYWYFSGCVNSTGLGVRLWASGTPLVARDDLLLEASDGIPGDFGLFLQGRSSISTPFKDGCLCVGYPTERLGITQFDQWGKTDSTGKSLVTKGNVLPGETIQYQLWYRDSSGPCGTGSNFSNGIEVVWW